MSRPKTLDCRLIYLTPNGETYEGVWFPEEIVDMNEFLLEALAPQSSASTLFDRVIRVEFRRPSEYN